MIPTLQPAFRRERLRDALPRSIHLLRHQRGHEIAPGYIDDYLALRWLEGSGESIRLTATGEDLCQQLTQAREGLARR